MARVILRALAFGVAAAIVTVAAVSGLRESKQPSSDPFWAMLHVEAVYEGHGSLEALTDASDYIVVGRMESVVNSETVDLVPEWGPDGRVVYSTVLVKVEAALKAPDPVGTSIEFDLFVPDPKLADSVAESLPTERLMLFLVKDGGHLRLTSPVSYVRDVDGAQPPIDAEEAWLKALDGTSFSELADRVSN